MQDQEKSEVKPEEKPEARPEPAGPQQPEPVKSSSTRLQETIDQAAGQAEARRRLTEAIVNKRKKIAAEIEYLEKKAEAVQAANDAVPVVVPDMKAAPVHFLTPKDEQTGQVAICEALGSPSIPTARYHEETTNVLCLVNCLDCLKEMASRWLYVYENRNRSKTDPKFDLPLPLKFSNETGKIDVEPEPADPPRRATSMTSPNPQELEPEIPDDANLLLDELIKMRDQAVELQRAQVDVLCDIKEGIWQIAMILEK